LQTLVSPSEVEEFDLAIALACRFQSAERLEFNLPPGFKAKEHVVPDYFYRNDGCMVLSFDRSWYPFLDNTRGYNRGPQRWYVPKRSSLLANIGVAMQSPEQRRFSGGIPGGRVFMDSLGVVRCPPSRGEVELLAWNLPRESHFLRDRHPKPIK
jgi:hypothetical protein